MDIPDWARCAIELIAQRPLSSTAAYDKGQYRAPEMLAKVADVGLDSLLPPIQGNISSWQKVYRKMWQCQKSFLISTVKSLRAEGIDPAIVKGAYFNIKYFSDQPVSYMHDFDIVIEREEVAACKQVLIKNGYAQAHFDREKCILVHVDAIDVSQYEYQTKHEIFPFSHIATFPLEQDEEDFLKLKYMPHVSAYNGFAYVQIGCDVHYALHDGIETGAILSRCYRDSLLDCRMMNPTDHLWFSVGKYYQEIVCRKTRSLKEMFYIATLIRREEIDWDRIQLLSTLGGGAGLYYILSFLDGIGGCHIPRRVIDDMSIRLKQERQDDYGWQLGYLFDFIEPFPLAPALSAAK